MGCNPTPETLCGNTLPDTCVIFTGEINECFEYTGPCVSRQSQFNDLVQTAYCGLLNGLTGALHLLNFNSITIPACWVGTYPVPTNIATTINQLWTYICANQGMGTPIVGVNPKCLQDSCGVPITTLGPLLQALVDSECDEVGTVGVYRAVLTQSGTSAPVATILENSIKVSGVITPIVWTRTGAGVYIGTLANVFTANKTFMLMGPVGTSTPTLVRTSTSVVTLSTNATDGSLTETAVEIRIYP